MTTNLNMTTTDVRPLSTEEIDHVSGGIHPAAVLILAAAAGAGWKLGSSISGHSIVAVGQSAAHAVGDAAQAVASGVKKAWNTVTSWF